MAALAPLAAGAAMACGTPLMLIRDFYAAEYLPTNAAEARDAFAADVAAAYLRDREGDDIGAIDFDFRYNAQDFEPSTPTLKLSGQGAATRVLAAVKRGGETVRVDYSLCQGARGWRIADAKLVGAQSWSLRRALKLPATVRC